MAELVSYLSIIPHMRWFDVPSPQNAETVLLVVEGDALDETRQHLAVGWFGLNFHDPPSPVGGVPLASRTERKSC